MLVEVIYKRPHVTHLVVCPLLMNHMCKSKFSKESYLMFNIPSILTLWTHTFHEPLLCSILLHLISKYKCWIVCVSTLVGVFQICLERVLNIEVVGRPLEPLLWEGNCTYCRKILLNRQGILYANFSCKCVWFPPLLKAWYGTLSHGLFSNFIKHGELGGTGLRGYCWGSLLFIQLRLECISYGWNYLSMWLMPH